MTRAATIPERLALGLSQAVEVGDCLEWQGSFSCKGVTPVVKAKDPNKDPSTRCTDNFSVPRLLWEKNHGPIPVGHLVYKECCNNACVLDGHLRCGTRKDWAKARKKAGVTRHSPVTRIALTLGARRRSNISNTIEKAREVRYMAAAQLCDTEIASQTGVSPSMVADIRRFKAWREIAASPWQGLTA